MNTSAHSIFIKDKKLTENVADFDYCWQHFDLSEQTNLDLITQDESISASIETSLVDQETRPRVETVDDGLLVILRGVNLNPEEESEDMISLRIWATKEKIVTAQYRPLKTTTEFLSRAKSGKPEASVSVLLAKLVSTLFSRVEQIVMSLSDNIDSLEESVSDSFEPGMREQISLLRKKVVVFKRHLLPQREVVSQLRYSSLTWFHDDHRDLHNENYERVMRNIEDLEMMREKLNIIKEEVQYLLSEKLNRNTYVLSMVTAIFLPLGFLTGLLGINIGGMPGANNDQAFWIFCGMLVTLVVIQIIIFRKKGWF